MSIPYEVSLYITSLTDTIEALENRLSGEESDTARLEWAMKHPVEFHNLWFNSTWPKGNLTEFRCAIDKIVFASREMEILLNPAGKQQPPTPTPTTSE